MAGTTHPRPDRAVRPAVLRFDRVERAVHWVNALLFLVLILTGAALYLEPIAALVGRRHLVEDVHVACGIALPVPVLLAAAGRWGRGLRADLGRLNRFVDADRAWLRAAGRPRAERRTVRAGLATGKFNAGQKLNTAFTGGAIVVMLASGLVMRWYHPWPLSFRTGATFVHDWLSFAIVVVLAGHLSHAFADPAALRAMWRGDIRRSWADRHAPAWAAEMDALERT
jgi:cytochrome b subunit of formate dehydrogenase